MSSHGFAWCTRGKSYTTTQQVSLLLCIFTFYLADRTVLSKPRNVNLFYCSFNDTRMKCIYDKKRLKFQVRRALDCSCATDYSIVTDFLYHYWHTAINVLRNNSLLIISKVLPIEIIYKEIRQEKKRLTTRTTYQKSKPKTVPQAFLALTTKPPNVVIYNYVYKNVMIFSMSLVHSLLFFDKKSKQHGWVMFQAH